MISLTLFAIEGIFLFQAFNFEEELPEYDMDSEDEEWLKNFNKKKVTLCNHTELLKQDMHWMHDVDVFDTWCLSFPKFCSFEVKIYLWHLWTFWSSLSSNYTFTR